MRVIEVDNVHQALPEGCRLVLNFGRKTQTRNGPATVLSDPLTTVYREPRQRVLFWSARDANPFFHLFECIWMLAGRRDVAWIGQFNSKIAEIASDDGVLFNGAYGHRWRSYFGVDQLAEIIRNLRVNPLCRRQVLTMWSTRDLTHQQTKDVPCNTQAYFQINTENKLELMVTNRSNDLIWGAYGANAVHFSFLLELMAHFIGVEPGRYFQVSMNTHLYEPLRSMAETLAGYAPDAFGGSSHRDMDPYHHDRVTPRGITKKVEPYPIAKQGDFRWFHDAELFMEGTTRGYSNPFFPEVALPLLDAWTAFKSKDSDRFDRAVAAAETCVATDWRCAAIEWLLRRAV